MYIFIAILAIIVIAMIVLISKKWVKKVTASYREANGRTFKIKGDEDTFIISKNKQYDFLVKQGRIVASRDRSRSRKFVYYEGE